MIIRSVGRVKIMLLLVLIFSCSNVQAQQGTYNMSYLFFGSPTSYVNQVNKTKGSLQMVSPNYFDLGEDGSLEITWRLQTSFINEMHNRGMKVVPFLSNHWNKTRGINGLNNREKLARDIAEAVEYYNLDGVNVDIEGIGHNYRDVHTDFIRLLRQYIPIGKEVSVAVAANPNGWNTGWHGFYDYKGISQFADYLMIMAYDESWEGPESPIGPVASLPFSERSIQYALNQTVSGEKIVYGIPFYARMWKIDGPTIENRSITGMGLSSTRIQPLITQFDGIVKYNEKAESPYVTFTIPEGESTFIGSTKLTQGNYIIWYENERSLKAKLQLPRKYGIKGTGSWALMHETPETWNFYSLWLKGNYFTDVPDEYWGEKSILYVAQRGWMYGISSTAFSPNTNLTRAQGAVILVRALENERLEPEHYRFTDVKGHWAQREIEIARELGYVNGVTIDRYDPDAPLTREQLARVMYNIFKFPIEENVLSPFSDVPVDRGSYRPIVSMYQKGYLNGFGDGSFRPAENTARVQMAALMERMKDEIDFLLNKQH